MVHWMAPIHSLRSASFSACSRYVIEGCAHTSSKQKRFSDCGMRTVVSFRSISPLGLASCAALRR